MQDRMADIAPLLRHGMRVLEIGCAEGSLGTMVRQSLPVHYTGIELSEDAAIAARVLDRVVRTPVATLVNEKFDLLLSFHVLEHVADVTAEIRHWRKLLDDDGRLIIEVPNQAGHRLLDLDPNPEHLHQFSVASIAALLIHEDFEVDRIESGHWESSVYSNSLRVFARPALTGHQRRALLLQRFQSHLPDQFAAWGIGGDFRAYVEPLLDSLPVAALIDSAEQRQGERHGHLTVETYDERRHGALPILVCSVRYRDDILRNIDALGIPSSRIVSLDDVFGPSRP
ncbi:class I SAM-dependent methyltransferase [Sulfuritalea hydrogenivorans]|jgi:SAM-dependent methyltransferase|nr:class I SAM-dependent methyltransferase [Sulfuritalea hydrogenivorans]